jgi:predicted metal-dependent hydrolase
MEYTLIRSKRKTISIQVTEGGLIVRAPSSSSVRTVERFIAEHAGWIEKRRAELGRLHEAAEELPPLTPDDVKELALKAKEYIPQRVALYADALGVKYARITIRSQKTRWGSCSSKGNLNFNCLLMLTSPEVTDSVVVHELCHLKHMDHSKKFYDEVRSVFPEYDRWNAWLKKNGKLILMRANLCET